MASLHEKRKSILGTLKSRNAYSFYLVFLMWGFCTLFYYFGELVELAGWEALRLDFFYGVHDFHRLLFLAPLIYASYVFGMRAAVIITVITLMTFLPRALLISPFPDPLLRMILFILIGGAMAYLTARVRGESERRSQLEVTLRGERDRLLDILERMKDGVLIIGPDYRIQFMNRSMIEDFGEGLGSCCYQYLYGYNKPCRENCGLEQVISGGVGRRDYNLPDGRSYEIIASPYENSEGVVCQLTVFRRRESSQK